jgi:circadian clock protein KaiC
MKGPFPVLPDILKYSNKAPSGIKGFDAITRGGFPRGRSSLILGGPGSGKTVLSLQALVNGAKMFDEPGIFVAFEENSKRIIANAATFGWNLPELTRTKMFFLDAQPAADLEQSGGFDLNGMLAALDVKVREMGARRIVFDSLDILLNLLDHSAQRREANRLNDWIMKKEITTLLTGKAEMETGTNVRLYHNDFMPFMVDSVVELIHRVVDGVSQRGLRVTKYRGSGFSENECPYVIGSEGFEIAAVQSAQVISVKASDERLSSGVKRLDTMLGGGYFRGAGILITGAPGTAKTTLAGAFASAACVRGERTLFVSFDSLPDEIIRNLESVNINLRGYRKSGLLQLISARAGSFNSEIHFLRIKGLAEKNKIRCLVIDPVSALGMQGNELTAHGIVERLVDWTKEEGITLFCTSLLDDKVPDAEASALQISTIADTWIHLNYQVRAGERNRALTIVKSRGTAHSNQVRELVLKDSGITLADVYAVGGEVFLGTLRWEKENAKLSEEKLKAAESERRMNVLRMSEADLESRAKTLQLELDANRREQVAAASLNQTRLAEIVSQVDQFNKRRGSDAVSALGKAVGGDENEK